MEMVLNIDDLAGLKVKELKTVITTMFRKKIKRQDHSQESKIKDLSEIRKPIKIIKI